MEKKKKENDTPMNRSIYAAEHRYWRSIKIKNKGHQKKSSKRVLTMMR